MTDGSVPAVFFLSDYGLADEFVGVVHAALHRDAPGVRVVDVTHGIAPFDIALGASVLTRCVRHLGPGVVLAVVDPGVGTSRRGVAVRVRHGQGAISGGGDEAAGPAWFVGPDNGLLPDALAALGGPVETFALHAREPATAGSGPTFDGRDLFAPVAAHLVLGGAPDAIGLPVESASLVPTPERTGSWPAASRDATSTRTPVLVHGTLRTAVDRADRFGNLALRAAGRDLDALGVPVGGTADVEVLGNRLVARRVVAFADLRPDELGLLVDSDGRVALVRDRAPATELLGGAPAGRPVTISLRS